MLDHLEQEKPKIFKIYFTHMEPKPLGENDIWVNDVTELKRIMYCIGNDSNIIFDEQMKKIYPDVFSMYSSGEVHTLLEDLKCGYKEPDTAVDILKKIPVPMQIPDNMGNNPQAIEKKYVHKDHSENVFISVPKQIGNLFYFQGFPEISEIQTDHESDHFDGIKIFEVARQASIAAMALNGFPLDAINILTKNAISYKNFIDKNIPYYIQTLPAVKPKGGHLYCAFSIMQSGKTCAYGYFAGVGYTSREDYLKIRKRGN